MFKTVKLELTNFISYKHQVFEFDLESAKIIVGINNDNASQKGNGSGKSALIEAICIALTNTTIRDTTAKELVRRGHTSAIVLLELINTQTNKILRIKRTIDNTASNAVELRYATEDIIDTDAGKVVKSSVNEYNAEILRILDISKEDLFSFFILTKETYQCFLTSGDATKKEIINRFSGAYKIDPTEDLIKGDIEGDELKLQRTDLTLSSNRGKQELLSNQINDEKNKKTPEYKAALSKDLYEQLDTSVDIAAAQSQKADKVQLDYDTAEKKFQAEKYQDKIAEQETVKVTNRKDIIAKQEEIDECQSIIDASWQNINKRKVTHTQAYKEIEDKIKDLRIPKVDSKANIAKLQTAIRGAVHCPKCAHEFILFASKSLDVLKEELVVENKALAVLEEKEKGLVAKQGILEDNLTKDVLNDQQVIDDCKELMTTLLNERRIIEERVNAVQSNIDIIARNKTVAQHALNVLLDSLTAERKELSRLMEAVNSIESQIGSLTDDSIVDKKIGELQAQWSKLIDQEDLLLEESDKLTLTIGSKKEWIIYFKNFKSYIANQSIEHIASQTNDYLKAMGTDLQIKMDGFRLLKNNKIKEQITTSVYRDGLDEGSYGKFSAGERARIDLAVILAIQQLININCSSGGLDLLIADEVLESIDIEGMQFIMNALKDIKRTVLIVSQNEISALKSQTIFVTKTSAVSTISYGA